MEFYVVDNEYKGGERRSHLAVRAVSAKHAIDKFRKRKYQFRPDEIVWLYNLPKAAALANFILGRDDPVSIITARVRGLEL